MFFICIEKGLHAGNIDDQIKKVTKNSHCRENLFFFLKIGSKKVSEHIRRKKR